MFDSFHEVTVTVSPRRRAILEYVDAHVAEHGYPPTVREICAAVGLSSPSTVHAHLTALERHGLLRRDASKPRALSSVGRSTERAPAPLATPGVQLLPLVGSIAAGAPILAEEHIEEEIAVPDVLTATGRNFLLRVRGDSMINAGILDGDFVVVREQEDAEEGEIVAALVDGEEATVKRIYRDQGRVRLQPENPALSATFPDDVSVMGKVVGVFRRVR